MAANNRAVASFALAFGWLLVLLSCQVSHGTRTDFVCLQNIRASLKDPDGYLSNWDFSNKTEGSICKFNGIECWHSDENRVLSIRLSHMGLQGQFPLRVLANCSSLITLSLSDNSLYGSLPSDISDIISYLTVLDLSNNDFSGPIPKGLANCTYLNDLNLAHNRFSGKIPLELGNLQRLRTFSVADNDLTGQIPYFNGANVTKDDYADNAGLCGRPILDQCEVNLKLKLAFKVGLVTACICFVCMVACFAYKFGMVRAGIKGARYLAGDYARLLSRKGVESVKVYMFDKTVPKITWGDFIKATGGFSGSNVIGSQISGKIYKATLRDGTCLMVKRLQNSNQTKKEFLSEVTALRNLEHPSLVPLLGYCIAKKEKLLVYKYMPYGNLFDLIHPTGHNESSILGWPMRLKIAIEVAEGLAWLDQAGIHAKVSSKSILLDGDFKPRFYELGVTRVTNPSQAHFSTLARGEVGDMWFTALESSNVYSFGVVLLELVTGEKPSRVANTPRTFKGGLVEWIHDQLESGTSSDSCRSVIDKSLFAEGAEDDLLQFLNIACRCVSTVPKERLTISQVCRLLKAIGERVHIGDGDITGEV